MPESVYDVILLIGSSKESWEKAAANAIEQASKSLRDLRVAEIVELDMQLDEGNGGSISREGQAIVQNRTLKTRSPPSCRADLTTSLSCTDRVR